MIPHSRPSLGRKDVQAVARVLHFGWVAQGPEVEHFEKAAARFLGVKGAVAVSSGTAALALALKALRIKAGDGVLVPSFACAALHHACDLWGARAQPVDVNPLDLNFSAEDARKRLKGRSRAVVLTHAFGSPADVAGARRLGLPVVEDLAQSLGATDTKGRKLGSLGEAAILSFYATKLMTTGEGGMVASNDLRLLDRVRDMRDYDEKKAGGFRFNFKMTDFQAALGRAQLSRLPRFLRRRHEIAHFYSTSLFDADCELPQPMPGRVFYRYVVRVPGNTLEGRLKEFRRRGVAARKALHCPLHRVLKAPGAFPVTDDAWKRALSLPLYPSLTREQRQRVARAAKEVLK